MNEYTITCHVLEESAVTGKLLRCEVSACVFADSFELAIIKAVQMLHKPKSEHDDWEFSSALVGAGSENER